MPGFAKASRGLLKTNWRTGLLFELVYKALFSALVVPLANLLVTISMYASRCYYLTGDNLEVFLLMPTTWIFLVIGLVFVAAYVLFEMVALVICFEASREGRKISLTRLVELSAAQVKRIVRKHNRGLIAFVLLLVPFANIGLISSAIKQVHIPEFISEFIDASALLCPLCVCAGIALGLLAFFWMFSVHYYALFGMDFRASHKASRELVRKKKRYPVLRLLLVNVCLGVLCLAGSLAATGWLLYARPSLGSLTGWDIAEATAVLTAGTVAYYLFSCLAMPIAYAVLSQSFYELLEKKGLEMPPALDYERLPKERRVQHARRIGVVAVLAVLACAATNYALINTGYVESMGRKGACALIAHRGAAFEAPENTVEAFQQAIGEGAEWVELDVQMTRDGTLVVMHDSNLYRTTGVDEDIWDVDYSDIKDLDNGSWFKPSIYQAITGSDGTVEAAVPDFSSARICTLDQALAICKGRIKVNIEVKMTGHGDDLLVQKVLNAINKYNMKDEVAVASLQYKCLEDVKRIDPRMKTIYNMVIAYGDISKLEDVDIFSVDEAFVTPALVATAHRYGKTFWTWTVNDPENMYKMYSYGVDGLVTDDIMTARSITQGMAYGESVTAWQLLGDLSAGNNAGS